jgi:glycosyltransferase involved in cell wall biosynthesis
MRRIAFFTYNEWAFGSIHKALIKELYKNGIDSNIIDWNISYSREEFNAFMDTYDVFVTVPGNAITALLSYGVPYSSIIAIAHGRYDIQFGISEGNDFNSFRAYGGVSSDLSYFSQQNGINKEFHVVRNGINFDEFYRPVAEELNVIGYSGVIEKDNPHSNIKDWKRGYLVQDIASKTDTKLLLPSKRSHLAMSAYYKDIDCLMVSSTEQESCGLPLLEAAAAGRLPISTLTGINRDFDKPTGIILPMEEERYLSGGINSINLLKENPHLFNQLCTNAQEFARMHYDWSIVIDDWITLITK